MVPRSHRYIRVIKHEAVKGCGSFEVRFPDGRESRYFYFDDVASRRIRREQLTRDQAQARELAQLAQNRWSALGRSMP